MKLSLKLFFSTEVERYRVVKEERYPDHKYKRMCMHCRKCVYNRLQRGPFCAHHKTPVDWFMCCAYFAPTWGEKI